METNAPFIGRVEKGVETSVYITEFAVIRIRANNVVLGPTYKSMLVRVGIERCLQLAQGGRATCRHSRVAVLEYELGEGADLRGGHLSAFGATDAF